MLQTLANTHLRYHTLCLCHISNLLTLDILNSSLCATNTTALPIFDVPLPSTKPMIGSVRHSDINGIWYGKTYNHVLYIRMNVSTSPCGVNRKVCKPFSLSPVKKPLIWRSASLPCFVFYSYQFLHQVTKFVFAPCILDS